MEATAQAYEREEAVAMVEKTDLNSPILIQDENPLEVRWAFNGVHRDKPLNPRECGYSKAPFARFFPVKAFETPMELHTTDDNKEKEVMSLVMASDAQAAINQALGDGGIQEKFRWGVRFGFLGEKDAAKMEVISQTLVPPLSRIRAFCAESGIQSPISDVCEGSEDDDAGPRESCPTCWNKWLHSPAVSAHMAHIANHGMRVKEFDPKTHEITERVVKPSTDEFAAALALVRDSFREGLTTLRDMWGLIAAEYEDEKSGRRGLIDFEHQYRKDLHRSKPQDRQIAIVRELSRAAQGSSGVTDAALAQLAQTQAQIAALLAQNMGGVPAPAPIPEPEKPSGETVIETVVQDVELSANEATDADTEELSPAAKKLASKIKKAEAEKD